ncbi:MAG: hypothetical protein KY397_01420 [Gemmatimonadetes bacterium]|nr:hypothetical protein [Gemmatimonadota bacterium]
MTTHLEITTIYALLDGELEPLAERSAEGHLLRCAECRAVREECGAVLASLRWYAAAPPPPPVGYWSRFWERFADRVSRTPERPAAVRRPRPAWRETAMAAAAVLALLLGTWWGGLPRDEVAPRVSAPASIPARMAVADTGWESDVEFFERATVAVGSVDPLTKGLALAALVESP